MTAPPKFYAHSDTSEDREHWHRLSEHLHGTGLRAAGFLAAVGGADISKVAGLLHDLGKYTREFQARLSGGHRRVNHSTAGAKTLTSLAFALDHARHHQFARQRGSHRHFKGIVRGRTRVVVVPGAEGEDVPKGTLGSIRRQSGLPARIFR